MRQAKFTLSDSQVEFLEWHQALGFSDKSSMVRQALDDFRAKIAQERLEASADLYAEVYAEDEDLQALTEQALEGWPE